MATLRVTYGHHAELRQDLEGQLVHGGILVRADPAEVPGLALGAMLTVELMTPAGAVVRGAGQVLHLAQTPPGIAVTFPADQVAALRTLLQNEGAASDTTAPPAPAHHGWVPDAAPAALAAAPQAPAAPPSPAPHAPPAPGERRNLDHLSSAEKVQVALHGSQEERTIILRDKNRMLHPYVLRNPQISPEEILAIAKNPQSSVELLQIIAGNKDWVQRPQIALAVVRNPKTPQGAGVRALDFVAIGDLRLIAKGGGAPPHIVTATRKKIL